MNKRGAGYFTIILVFIFGIVGFLVSQQASQSDFDVGKFKDAFNWTNVEFEIASHPELANALGHFVNGFGNAIFEFAKWVVSFAAENPEISYKLVIYLVIFSLLAPILLSLFKILIISFILIKEYFQNRKEKRKLKKLKEQRK